MDCAEFQKISGTILEKGELAGLGNVEHYGEAGLLGVLADASNKKEGEIEHVHVLAAMELKQRLELNSHTDCGWEIAEIFRKIYSKYMDMHPYAHIEVEKEARLHGILCRAKKLYRISRHLLLWAYTNKKHELNSIDNNMAPILLGEPTYKPEQILKAARLLKKHFLLGRFTEENLEKAHRALAFFKPEPEDEEVICAKAELIGILYGEEGVPRIEEMLKRNRKQLSFPAARKIQSLIEQFSIASGELQKPPAAFRAGPIRRRPNVHCHTGKIATAVIVKKA